MSKKSLNKNKATGNNKSKLSRKKKFNKIVVLGMAGLMILSTVGGLVTSLFPSSSPTITEYNTDVDLALTQVEGIDEDKIEKVVNKHIENDYTLKTMIDILGENPVYIAKGYDVTSEDDEVTKLIDKYVNKKSYKNTSDLIELAWKTNKNKIITTYLASDITEKVNVVGLFITDNGLDMTTIDKNENVSKTELAFEEFADVKQTLTELESKTGKTYSYSTKYPLLKNSEIVKENSKDADISAVVSQRLLRTSNSTIVVHVRDNNILSVTEMPDNYDKIANFEEKLIKEAKENKSLKEDDFKETFKNAKLVGIEEVEDSGSVLTTYLIKDKKDNVYNVAFENGKVSTFEGGAEETETSK